GSQPRAPGAHLSHLALAAARIALVAHGAPTREPKPAPGAWPTGDRVPVLRHPRSRGVQGRRQVTAEHAGMAASAATLGGLRLAPLLAARAIFARPLQLPDEMRLHRRPLGGDDAIDAGVAQRAVGSQLMAAQHPVELGAEAQDRAPALRIEEMRAEFDG